MSSTTTQSTRTDRAATGHQTPKAPVAQDLRFTVPRERIASVPGERRGVPRDQTPMLVASPDGIMHRRAVHLAHVLRPRDLVVVNTSSTRPAALAGAIIGSGRRTPVAVHLSTPRPPRRPTTHPTGTLFGRAANRHGRRWIVEIRRLTEDRSEPWTDLAAGTEIALDGPSSKARVRLLAPAAAGPDGAGVRLWRAVITGPLDVVVLQARHGRPISYDRPTDPWPLADYQTVFARSWGSAEMPSAARPFTPALVTHLNRHGISVAEVELHAGVSSAESSEAPQPEQVSVSAGTAAQINATRAAGGRVIAVGTSVVRALETVAADDGTVTPGRGWTDLILGPSRPARVTGGLLTGWHEADASHLDLLLAVAGPRLVSDAYLEGLAGSYLWHEFGDVCLFIP